MNKINQAKYINKELDVKLFDENNSTTLVLIKYNKKQINEMFIDDLIINGKWSKRLTGLVHEILKKYNEYSKKIEFKPRLCTCGKHLLTENVDVTRKTNQFTDENGVHRIKHKAAICFNCNYCDTTIYQIFILNEES